MATGIKPRDLAIKGITNPIVKTYLQVLKDKETIGKKVAIIGAGGIGFDVASYLSEEKSLTTYLDAWLKEWGVDKSFQNNGALMASQEQHQPLREIALIQRKTTKVGAGLGKTTGWIHRATLAKNGVKMIKGATYKEVTSEGLIIEVEGKEQLLAVDHIIICAGQEPNRDLYQDLLDADVSTHLIGGASVASELDAKRAIRQAAELAASI